MDLKNLDDKTLLLEIEKLCKEERQILTVILHHLREIERRKLYASLKYSSLFEYAVKELGHSEDQAYRRISAMKILREIPEIEEKINSGELQLSHLGMANTFFNKEKQYAQKEFSKNEKLEFLDKLSNKTAKDAEKIILSHCTYPAQFRPERERIISEEMVEINFVAKNQLKEKIYKLKCLLAHKSPHLSTAELIDQLCDLGLEKWGKGAYAALIKNNFHAQVQSSADTHSPQNEMRTSQNQSTSWESLKKIIWRRDKGQCQNCGSSYALEVDHILPKAKGGEDTINNLRLLCRSCNQRAAIQHFGLNKMGQHLN